MKPMKSVQFNPLIPHFPCFGSPKLDGYRSVGVNKQMLSNSLKPIRNRYVQFCMGFNEVNGLDGELIVGAPNHPQVFNNSSGLMAFDGEPDFKLYAFDDFTNPNDPYIKRLDSLKRRADQFNRVSDSSRVVVLEQRLIHSQEELDEFEREQIELGYEGIMTRRADGIYKFGRSTAKEGYLLKVKRFEHGEGLIIGAEELMHNENEAYIDELGRTARSTAQENLVPSGMLGAYIVEHPDYEKPFKVSCGTMTHEQRRWAWENLNVALDKVTRYKWFPHGTKDVPRHPLWDGMRDNDDLGEDHPLYKIKK
jgi:DNA ligase 1